MTYSYTKLDHSMIGSTVWLEPANIRLVWITLLLLCDWNGKVGASIPGLAFLARVPESDCEAAIEKFLAPDPKSRSQEYEGRRIERIDGGWRILNHNKIRDGRNGHNDERREYGRQKKAESRKNPIAAESKAIFSEFGFSDRVLMRKIDDALKANVAATKKEPKAVAAQMIQAYRAYSDYAEKGMLRFQWAPRKFFEQGFWTTTASWPIKTPPRVY